MTNYDLPSSLPTYIAINMEEDLDITRMTQWNPGRRFSQPSIELRQVSENTSMDGQNDAQETNSRHPVVIRTERTVLVRPSQDRSVNRKLRGVHLFMITINATVGTGLYWRGGQILRLGGPLSVVFAFLLVGFIVWAVMQCITEMLCIWPIPGAFSTYVGEFVDTELGIVVGVAYWFTYSVSFSALMSTMSAELQYWTEKNQEMHQDAFTAGVVYALLPIIMVFINCLEIEWYGYFEMLTGSVKIFLYCFIVLVLILVLAGGGSGPLDVGSWAADKISDFDHEASDNWARAFLMCTSIASFAYVGVEVVAASALEVRPRKRHTPTGRRDSEGTPSARPDLLIGKTVKFSSKFISIIITFAYVLAGILISLQVKRDSQDLPQLSWINYERAASTPGPEKEPDVSIFVVIAKKIPGMDHVFNAILFFTAFTCASTNLYIASRSLFGLTSRLRSGSSHPWHVRMLAWFGHTNHHRVPIRAVIFSAVAFFWVPFLNLAPNAKGGAITIEVLATMGTVGVQIVWACLSLAFIRYYQCIERHKEYLSIEQVPHVQRWNGKHLEDYPYRSHGQPVLGYVALAGCLFLLIVCHSAALWGSTFHIEPFLSSMLILVVFLFSWALLKILRGARWRFVDLSDPAKVERKIRKLHDIRAGAS